jgi:serine/threonine-protein kinase RsbW
MSEPRNETGGAPPVAPDPLPPAPTVAEPRYGRPARPVGLSVSYPAVGPAVTEARSQVTRWLRAAGEDELMISDVALAVTEACTNVVVHAYRERGTAGSRDLPRFRVIGELDRGALELTVSDEGCGMKPRLDSPGLGLGVPLVAGLTDRVVVGAQPNGSGTVVVMSFTAAGTHSRNGRDHS